MLDSYMKVAGNQEESLLGLVGLEILCFSLRHLSLLLSKSTNSSVRGDHVVNLRKAPHTLPNYLGRTEELSSLPSMPTKAHIDPIGKDSPQPSSRLLRWEGPEECFTFVLLSFFISPIDCFKSVINVGWISMSKCNQLELFRPSDPHNPCIRKVPFLSVPSKLISASTNFLNLPFSLSASHVTHLHR